jgi:hypothetical protein
VRIGDVRDVDSPLELLDPPQQAEVVVAGEAEQRRVGGREVLKQRGVRSNVL